MNRSSQASLSITNSRSSRKPMSIESVMSSNHLILFHSLLLMPSIFTSIRIFSSESALCIRWPKYWSFSFSISPPSEHPAVISFRMDWLDLLAVQGTKVLLLWKWKDLFSNRMVSAFGLTLLISTFSNNETKNDTVPERWCMYFFCLQDPAQYSAFTSHLIHSFDNTNSVDMGRALELKNQSTSARDTLLGRCKETQVQSRGGEDPLEEGMATRSSMLAWRIPRTDEPGGLQSMELKRIWHNWSDLACMLLSKALSYGMLVMAVSRHNVVSSWN